MGVQSAQRGTISRSKLGFRLDTIYFLKIGFVYGSCHTLWDFSRVQNNIYIRLKNRVL